MLATDCVLGITVRFKDGFSRYLRGKRFEVVAAPRSSDASVLAEPGRYIVTIKRLDVKRPYTRLAYVDCLVKCD